ncbi:MAG: EboA domain-containing protein [Nitrospiraceae bacterium]
MPVESSWTRFIPGQSLTMTDPLVLSHFLFQCLGHRVASSVRHHLEALEHDLHTKWSETLFTECFGTMAQLLGRTAVRLTDKEMVDLNGFGVMWKPSKTLDELGRTAFLMIAATHLPDLLFQSQLQRCYDNGDPRERRAVLRTLPLLPEAERFVPIAVDACRSHVQPIFEAVACENFYPAGHFPERYFNQMVLKALFTGTSLDRIFGLERRVTEELLRMAADYAAERLAAGRSVPMDIERLGWQMK